MARKSWSSRNLPSVWKTGTGAKLSIKDMETRHILNCAKFLRRKAADLARENVSRKTREIRLDSWGRFLKSFEKELKRRKEVKKGIVQIDWLLFVSLIDPKIKVKYVIIEYGPIIKGEMNEKVTVKSDPDWNF